MDEQRQAQHMETYLQALRHDLDALPSPELDAAMAAFARKLVRTQSAHRLQPSVKAEMWQAALHAAQNPFDPKAHIQQEEQVMNTTWLKPTHNGQRFPLAWGAAVVVVALIGFISVVMLNLPPAPDYLTESIGFGRIDENETDNENNDEHTIVVPSPTPVSTGIPITAPPPLNLAPTLIFYQNILESYQPVLTAFVPIPAGTRIREDMLAVVLWPNYQTPSGAFADYDEIVGKYAAGDIPRFMPVLDDFITDEFPFPIVTMTPIGGVEEQPTALNPEDIHTLDTPPAPLPLIATSTPTLTPTVTPSATSTPTLTPTVTPSATPTVTPTATLTATSTPTSTPTLTPTSASG